MPRSTFVLSFVFSLISISTSTILSPRNTPRELAAPVGSAEPIDPNDSLAYCRTPLDNVPCTFMADPMKGTSEFYMPENFVAHYECFITDETVGDRYLAGHPDSGGTPCFVNAEELAPLVDCQDPTARASLCECQKSTLVHCCDWSKARGYDLSSQGVACSSEL